MPESITNELIYEVLKQLQGDISDIKRILNDHGKQLISIREQLHIMEGNSLR